MLCIYFYMIMLYIDMTHKGCCYLFVLLLLLLQLLFNEFFLLGSFVQILWFIFLQVRSFFSFFITFAICYHSLNPDKQTHTQTHTDETRSSQVCRNIF